MKLIFFRQDVLSGSQLAKYSNEMQKVKCGMLHKCINNSNYSSVLVLI